MLVGKGNVGQGSPAEASSGIEMSRLRAVVHLMCLRIGYSPLFFETVLHTCRDGIAFHSVSYYNISRVSMIVAAGKQSMAAGSS